MDQDAGTSTGKTSSSRTNGMMGVVPFSSATAKTLESRPTQEILWQWVVFFSSLHVAALYGVWLMFTSARIITSVYALLLFAVSGVGVTAGAHRLWCHRAYKATWPLRVLLMLMNTMAFQDHIHEWALDHRLHHKYTETDADPYNSTRGFFYSHVGWLLVDKHPLTKEKAKRMDMRDIEQDPIVMFQKKYYPILMPLICFVIPTIIPVYSWNETWKNAWFVATCFRYAFSLNGIWLVNSAAHMWGNKPYDKSINPTENASVAFLATGEGWHNYHHTFPWDYKAAELGNYRANFATAFIDLFALIGWAYDLKTVPASMIQNRVKHSGDGSHEFWGDKDKPEDCSDYEQKYLVTYKNRKENEMHRP